MKQPMNVLLLEGPVSVAFRREGPMYCAIALQFDLVGMGKTKDEAFLALQSIFDTHMRGLLKEKGHIRFLSPAPESEWNLEDRQDFKATILVPRARCLPARKPLSYRALTRLHTSIKQFTLVPA